MTTTTELPMLLEEVEVRAVERLSPSFVRFEFGSSALAEFGVDGPLFDQRIKLVFPHDGGSLPSFEGADESWFATWMDRPVAERGHMRTYTVRAVRGQGVDTRLVVDFVLHGDGAHGPGGDWAARARVGDRLVMLAPRRGTEFGGIEFAPGEATRLLIVGDETAVPAVSAILEQLPIGARGAVFLEVPHLDDVLSLEHPSGIRITWLPRGGAAHESERGRALHAAVLGHLGVASTAPEVPGEEVDPDLWETPVYSSSGEHLDAASRSVGHDWDGLYAWIAGESTVVTGLRRALVRDLEIDRHQVAFMGYWRVGVSMKS